MPPGESSCFVFRRYKQDSYDGSDFEWEETPFWQGGYIGHTTKTFGCSTDIFRATQIKFGIRSFMVLYSLLDLEGREKDNEPKPDLSSPILDGKCKLIYIILNKYSQSKDGRKVCHPYGGCFFSFEDTTYETNFCIEPVASVYLRSHWIGADQRFPEESHYNLTAEYLRPEWFTQSENDKIVLPGANLKDFVTLILKAPPHSSMGLLLTGIQIQFFWIYQRPSCLRPIPEYKTIYQSTIHHELGTCGTWDQNNRLIVRLPENCHDCRIPQVGPTFSSGGFLRSYAIRFALQLEDTLRQVNYVQTALNINVAFLDVALFSFTPQIAPLAPSEEPETNEKAVYLTFLKTRLLSGSWSPDFLKEFFARLRYHSVKYQYHETTASRTSAAIVSKTTLKCLVPQEIRGTKLSEWITTTRSEMKKIGFGASFEGILQDEAIVYKSFWLKNSSISSSPICLSGAILMQPDGLSLTEFPPNDSEKEGSFAEVCEKPTRFTEPLSYEMLQRIAYPFAIDLNFRIPKGIIQIKDDNVVLPRMHLSLFLTMAISLPKEILQRCKEIKVDRLKITQIRVYFIEKHSMTAIDSNILPVIPFKEKKCKTLLDKKCDLIFSWDEFYDNGDGNCISYPIPKEVFDIQLPCVGPTFHTNYHSRTYRVKVLFNLYMTGSGWETLAEASKRVNVALACEEPVLDPVNISQQDLFSHPPPAECAFIDYPDFKMRYETEVYHRQFSMTR